MIWVKLIEKLREIFYKDIGLEIIEKITWVNQILASWWLVFGNMIKNFCMSKEIYLTFNCVVLVSRERGIFLESSI